VRFRVAVGTTRAVNAMSRRLGRGQGTVAGGRSGLRIDPQLLQHLSAGRGVALVTGTNGKTTTTSLLAAALGVDGTNVVSNETGSNMPPGLVAALAGDRSAPRAVLEVDEIYLSRVMSATRASTVVLLNLSRDQLDRTNEVRMVAGTWRAALAAAPHVTVVANADDPLVVWSAGAAANVRWVAAGLGWQLDAVGCPSCQGRIAFDGDGSWACVTGCGFARPEPMATLTSTDHGATFHGIWADGRSQEMTLRLPGRFNHANALMAAVAAETQGIDAADGLAAMATIGDVAGRFTIHEVGGVRTRLMLAKNPAGWSELLDLVGEDDGPVVVSINARTADGADPSWLWDVPFERLVGRVVVASGDRCRDLSVRLQYAGVAHTVEKDPVAAVKMAGEMAGKNGDGGGGGNRRSDAAANCDAATNYDAAANFKVDAIGNYTAFNDLLGGAATRRDGDTA
jgi:UDP-N-acetylmuramyl tripeptide synthase